MFISYVYVQPARKAGRGSGSAVEQVFFLGVCVCVFFFSSSCATVFHSFFLFFTCSRHCKLTGWAVAERKLRCLYFTLISHDAYVISFVFSSLSGLERLRWRSCWLVFRCTIVSRLFFFQSTRGRRLAHGRVNSVVKVFFFSFFFFFKYIFFFASCVFVCSAGPQSRAWSWRSCGPGGLSVLLFVLCLYMYFHCSVGPSRGERWIRLGLCIRLSLFFFFYFLTARAAVLMFCNWLGSLRQRGRQWRGILFLTFLFFIYMSSHFT